MMVHYYSKKILIHAKNIDDALYFKTLYEDLFGHQLHFGVLQLNLLVRLKTLAFVLNILE